jgi:hypothetical protein
MVRTSVRAGETLVASGSVVGARMTIMGNAARSPLDGDYAEIGDMVLEKVTAVSRVGQVLVDQWSVMLLDASAQAQHVGDVVLSGRPLSAPDLSRLAELWLTHGTRMIGHALETGGLALAPVHQQATANARHLG